MTRHSHPAPQLASAGECQSHSSPVEMSTSGKREGRREFCRHTLLSFRRAIERKIIKGDVCLCVRKIS